ncbi:hypothetical protein EYF80_033568 [Liparis tanakae]|uniref:Uncharacterized protein n=1 Tax=Liparis tanakae TaxID=230148 RepID=A0A4Z2GTZ0_9TELE|nr:hypothetical protein EYF80_033568 [Liparis tanakae]
MHIITNQHRDNEKRKKKKIHDGLEQLEMLQLRHRSGLNPLQSLPAQPQVNWFSSEYSVSSGAYWLSSAAYWLSSAAYWLSSGAYWLSSAAYWLSSATYCLSSATYWLSSAAYWTSAWNDSSTGSGFSVVFRPDFFTLSKDTV